MFLGLVRIFNLLTPYLRLGAAMISSIFVIISFSFSGFAALTSFVSAASSGR
jgi:hypothetical protein